MAQTIERLLLDAGVEKRDDRVVHLLVDLMQRETLTLLSAAAEVVDLSNQTREKGRKGGKTRGTKKAQGGSSLSDRAAGAGGGGEGGEEDASSMRIEEEHASVAVHEYMQKYLVQPNVILENARLCSLSNSLTCGTTSTTPAELLVHRLTNSPPGAGGGSIGLISQSSLLDSSGSRNLSGSSSGNGGSFLSTATGAGGGGGGMSLGMHALIRSGGPGGGGGGSSSSNSNSSSSTSKNVLGVAPEGLPPYLPEDISVNTLLPSWSLRIRGGGGEEGIKKKKKKKVDEKDDEEDEDGGGGDSRFHKKDQKGKDIRDGEIGRDQENSQRMKEIEESENENLLLLGLSVQ
ncbi:hypothetical protein CSUI_011118, partial [Cystoisospora suis]